MLQNKYNFFFKISRAILILFLFIVFSFGISIKKLNAFPHDWVGVPKSKYGEQLWDRKSLKRNGDGSLRVLSKFIPKTKSEITKDIFYTMDINCFEKSFRDVDVSTDQLSNHINNMASWEDPNGDPLIVGIISHICNKEQIAD